MANLKVSLLDGQQVIDSVDGQLIVLPALVQGMSIQPGTSDATVLTRARAVCPGNFAHHPDTDNFPNATLREVRLNSVRSFTDVHVDLIYKAPGASDWVLEEISQSEYLQTWATTPAPGFGTTTDLKSWWSSDPANNAYFTEIPAGVRYKSVSVPKFGGKRILHARGWMLYADWLTVRATVKAALRTINKTQWGDNPVLDDRGMWLFLNMNTATNDLNHTKIIDLYFLNDERGHYPITVYRDQNGDHLAGGATEAQLLAVGPPDEGGQWMMNGLSRHSVYRETRFDNIFNFDPSQA